jgi:hypothetical protein
MVVSDQIMEDGQTFRIAKSDHIPATDISSCPEYHAVIVNGREEVRPCSWS